MLLTDIVPNPDWNRLIPNLGVLATLVVLVSTWMVTRKKRPDTGEVEESVSNLFIKINAIQSQIDEVEKELKGGVNPEKIQREINDLRVQAQEDRRQVFECFKQLIELSRKK